MAAMGRIFGLFIGLLVLAAVFGVVERLWPSVRGRRRTKQSLITDVTWWGFTPLVGRTFAGIFVAPVILSIARLTGNPLTVEHLKGIIGRDNAITRQPVGLQFIEFLVLADLFGYWAHRLQHEIGRLWRIHAVHHSSTELNWLSSVRVHPFNEALQNTAIAAPLI